MNRFSSPSLVEVERQAQYFKKISEENGRANFTYWRGLVEVAEKGGKGGDNRVLIIRPDGIGDFILFLPSLAGMREHYGDCHLTILAVGPVAELARASGLVDEVIVWDRFAYEERGGYWKEFLAEMSTFHVRTILYPCLSREANIDEIVAVISAREKIGMTGDYSNLKREINVYNNRFYTRVIEFDRTDRHESKVNDFFLQAIGANRGVSPPLYEFEDKVKVRALLDDQGIKGKYIVLVPGAGQQFKCWPREKFAGFIEWFLATTHWSVVTLGGEKEQDTAQWLVRRMPANHKVVSLAGKLSITQSAAVIDGAEMYVGNDTGLAHIAGIQGVLGHVLVGGAHFGRFFPSPVYSALRVHTKKLPCFGCDWRCQEKHYRCVLEAELPPEDLLASISQIEKTRS